MISSFNDHLDKKFSDINLSTRLLIAFSGGLDSVVLTELLYSLGYQVSLAHVNFSLRNKESDADAEFADHFAQARNIPFYHKKVDTKHYAQQKKISIQEAARDIRYNWFEELLQKEDLDYVLTAHHADDQIETLFINLIRGTGLKGLTGIPERRNRIIRPLLPFEKAELLKFAQTNNIKWREDSSNQSTDYLRNQVRHNLIPRFKDTSDQSFQQAHKSISLASQSYELFDELICEKLDQIVERKEDVYFISLALLKKQKQAKTLLFHFIQRFGFTNVEEVYDLSNKPKAKFVQNKDYIIIKERDFLVIQPIKEKKTDELIKIPSATGVYHLSLGTFAIEACQQMENKAKNVAYIDADQIEKQLILRKWKKGDIFQPFGMKGKKKVSDFLKDEKVAYYQKKNQWVLLSNDQIVWVVNHRIDEKFKITNNTKRCLKISYISS